MTAPDLNADYALTLTPRQAAFVHFLGRYLRKQDGWWDDDDWLETGLEVATLFEALPGGLPAQFDGSPST